MIFGRLYTELGLNQAIAIERADRVACPLLLQAAEPDQIVDVAGTRRFLERLEGGEVKSHFIRGPTTRSSMRRRGRRSSAI